MKLGEMLIAQKKISAEQLELCVDYQKINEKERIGSLLKHFNFTDDATIAEFVSAQIGLPLYTDELVPNNAIIDEMGIEYFTENQIFPLKKGSRTAFVLSFIDNVEITDVIRSKCGCENAEFYIGLEYQIRNALDQLLFERNRAKIDLGLLELNDNQSPEYLSQWFDQLLTLAIMQRATDIHIEPTHKGTEVRFRTDGILVFICCLKTSSIRGISNIVLTRCKKNPSEFNKFHDGRFDFKFFNRTVDLRFSQVPSMHGPALVLRILDKARASISLKSLGYSDHNLRRIEQAIKSPYGIILVTGPTGSGKSTTLYAVLNHIKSIEKKIITVEDPVEMTHSLMTQVQVNPNQGITFGNAIRAYLRQDPDIMLIGEIRDHETAQEAVRAAITGHQIFSTLHTNDAQGAVLRLNDLGIDQSNISSSLVGIVAQRLIRKLCKHCKKATTIFKSKLEPNEQKYLIEENQVVYQPVACNRCVNGYWGRTVVAEVLLINEKMRELIASNELGSLRKLVNEDTQYKTIESDIGDLLRNGQTSLEEAVRIMG